jgi:hypothetical protein
MTAAPLFTPAAFTARNGQVLFENRPITPAQRSEVKALLTNFGRQTEDVPTLNMLDAIHMQLVRASVAAVNQSRAALRAVSTQPTQRLRA